VDRGSRSGLTALPSCRAGEANLWDGARRGGDIPGARGRGTYSEPHHPSLLPPSVQPLLFRRNTLEEEPVEAVSLTSLAKRASHHEIEDMVNELDDDELAHLIVRGVRTVKRRMARGGQGDGRSTRTGSRRSALDRALQEIATELSGFDEPHADW
jgi:hypothetical protein